jgi:hypothetical protein
MQCIGRSAGGGFCDASSIAASRHPMANTNLSFVVSLLAARLGHRRSRR